MNDLKPGSLSIQKIQQLLRRREVCTDELRGAAVEDVSRRDQDVGSFLTVRGSYEGQSVNNGGTVSKASLNGVPCGIKDNLCTSDLPTTCASQMLSGYRPPYDATAVKLLRRAGAHVVGKTNMDEFAMGSSTENSAFAVTHNPWNSRRVPGGSSGGSAAAVAAGLVSFALGSDTGGSVRQPASFCGVVGMKPTYGSISRYGLVAFASSLDQIGPLARSVDDCARVLDVLVRHDERDSTSVKHPEAGAFASAVSESEPRLNGWRIGVPREFVSEGVDEPVRHVVREAADVFRQLGAQVQQCSLPLINHALSAYYIIACSEASSNLARYDGVRYGLRAESADVQEMFIRSRSRGFGQEVKRRIMLGTFALSAGYYEDYYLKAARLRRMISDQLNGSFEEYDLLLTPTTPTVAFRLQERMDDPLAMYMADVCTIPANLAGIPAISVPGGFHEGLPVGIQLMADRFDDRKLLTAARAFELSTGHHRRRPSHAEEGEMGRCGR